MAGTRQIHTDATGSTSTLLAMMAMLFLSALPDAMVVPMLRQLMVDRYGVSIGAAHAFMAVNLVGALVVVGVVGRLRHRLGLATAVTAAAGLNAALLATMALPIGFRATLAVRCVEGAADLMVYALLFGAIARSGSPLTRGRRMGAAATAMMLGIAAGIGGGGIAGRYGAPAVLWLGALACLVVAAFACVALRPEAGRVASDPGPSPPAPESGRLWPALVMMFSDRAVAGLLASTLPLYLTSVVRLSPSTTGGLIGIAMLMTALGAWPAGRLADRFGYRRLRVAAGIAYAGGFILVLPAVSAGPIVAAADMVVVGLGGAALFASSLLVVCRSGRGPAAMAAYHAAGNLGFLVGPLVAGGVLTLYGGAEPPHAAYVLVISGFALFHALTTTVTIVAVRRRSRPLAPDPVSVGA